MADGWPTPIPRGTFLNGTPVFLHMHDATIPIAERLLARIRADLLETSDAFGIDSDLFAAGLDSMAIMQLTLVIEEEFGMQLPDRLITRATFSTARQIAAAIRAAGAPQAR